MDRLPAGYARAFRLLVIAIALALTVPRMTQRGMFADGLMYATIARNMSEGAGTFWAPRFSETTHRTFVDHPPLGFALQAVTFRLLGDHPAVERIYAVAMFGLQGLLIALIWRRLLPADYDWLPVLLWLVPSIVTWAAINNMLENTQAVFASLAVFLLLIPIRKRSRSAVMFCAAGAGISVVAAALTKGPVGLFPLAVPLLCLALPPGSRPARLVLAGATLTAVVAGAAALLYAGEPSRHALTEYVRSQLVPSLLGERDVNGDPLSAMRHLGLGIVARMAVLAALCWAAGRRGSSRTVPVRPAVFFLIVALAASLPIAISPKMMGHYFLPSVPFFAIGVAAIALGGVRAWFSAESGARVPRVLTGVAATLLVLTVAVPLVRGSVEPRDRALVADLDALAPAISRSTTIGACGSAAADWRLQAYLQRFFHVSVDPHDAAVNGSFIQSAGCTAPASCAVVAASGTLALMRCPVGE